MKHSHMMIFCGVFVVVAIVLVAAGAGAFAILPALGCAVMMGMMVWMMVGGARHHGR